MKSFGLGVHVFPLALAVICTGLLIYKMVAILVFKEQIFLERSTINSLGALTILIAFISTKKFVDATGETGGYSCIVIFERSTRTAMVLLTNVSAFLASNCDYISKLGIELHNSVSVKE